VQIPDKRDAVESWAEAASSSGSSCRLHKGHSRAGLEVTYGTSNLKLDVHTLDLIVANATDLAEMGLPQATRFDLDRTVTLPWCEEFFVPRAGQQSPIIGHLNFAAVSQLEALKVMRRGR